MPEFTDFARFSGNEPEGRGILDCVLGRILESKVSNG